MEVPLAVSDLQSADAQQFGLSIGSRSQCRQSAKKNVDGHGFRKSVNIGIATAYPGTI